VIGYGSDLRGDDAVGRRAAEAVAAWELPHVRALAVHQLTPELAAALAAVDLAIFVDACVATRAGEIETQSIGPAAVDATVGHSGDPRTLLALAEALYGRSPRAWSIGVPATSFAFGADLSPVAQRGLADALQQIYRLLTRDASLLVTR
jgi:hydrogenase maturation protease